MPTISVIVPVYKVEPYLNRCVDSILRQTYQDFELILVDDGSPDRCGEICDEYARQDSRIHVIHKENGGLSDARNAGIDWVEANSDSRWLIFADSDDWVHPELLARLLDAATAFDLKSASAAIRRRKGQTRRFCRRICAPTAGRRSSFTWSILSTPPLHGGSSTAGAASGTSAIPWGNPRR